MRTRHGLVLAISLLLLGAAPGVAFAEQCECNDGQLVEADDSITCDEACEEMGGGNPAQMVNPNAGEESEADRARRLDEEPTVAPEQEPGPNRKP